MDQDFKNWSCDQVGDWLRSIGYENYVNYFADNRINGEVLFEMNTEELFRMVKVFNDLFKLGDIIRFGTKLTALKKERRKQELRFQNGFTATSGFGFGQQPSFGMNRETVAQNDITDAAPPVPSPLPTPVIQPTISAPPISDTSEDVIVLDESVDERESVSLVETSGSTVHNNSMVNVSMNASSLETSTAELFVSPPASKQISPAAREPHLMRNQIPPISNDVARPPVSDSIARLPNSGNIARPLATVPISQQQQQGQKRLFDQSASSSALAQTSSSSNSSVKSIIRGPSSYLSCYCIYQYPTTTFQAPEAGKVIRAFVSFSESPLEFSIVYENNMEKVKKLDFLLNRFYENDPCVLPLSQQLVVAGTACAAKFEGNWYRAVIKSVDGDNVSIRYVDYGNSVVLPRSSLMSLKRDRLTDVPPICIDCRLAGIPLDFDITGEQRDTFYDWVDPMERLFLVSFESFGNQVPYSIRMVDSVMNASLNNRVRDLLGISPPPPEQAQVGAGAMDKAGQSQLVVDLSRELSRLSRLLLSRLSRLSRFLIYQEN